MDGEDESSTGVVTMFRDRVSGDPRKHPPAGAESPAAAPPAKGSLLDPRPFVRTPPPREGEGDSQAPAKKADPLPCPGDTYRAHARFLNRLDSAPRMIHFVKADLSWEAFCYSDLRRLQWLHAADPGQGPRLLLRFVEAEITDVEVEGRHLRDVEHWISEGAMSWLWEKPPGVQVRDDAATVITRITIRAAKGRMSGVG